MKTATNIIFSIRYLLLTVLLTFGVMSIIASNGGSDGGGGAGDLFSGDYQIHKVEYEGQTTNFIAETFDGTADGKGNFSTDVGTIAYSLSDDRMISISIPGTPSVETEYGIISSDGSLVLLTDAQLVDPNNQDDVETIIVVKKSTDMTLTKVAGEYILSQTGRNAQGFYTSQVLVTLQSDGTGTWLILNHSQPAEVGLSGNLTFVGSADGTFTVDNGTGDDAGIISPDANIFVVSDGDMTDADGEAFFGVGVRKSTTAPTLTESFQIHFIGYDSTNAFPIGPQFAARWTVVEDQVNTAFEATNIVDSRGTAPGATATIPHTSVAADGTFVAANTDLSILSPAGNFFAVVETDTATDAEIKIGLALK
ncbi:hypothetical protein [Kaarinaea lacus]